MSIHHYGVLKGRTVKRIKTGERYEMLIATQERKYRASVNVRSQAFPSELLYYTISDFNHPITDQLRRLPLGFSDLESDPNNESLDYIRDNILTPSRMMIPSFNDIDGNYNDLHYELDTLIQPMLPEKEEEIGYILNRDKNQPLVYVFGERWGPKPQEDDPFFGFQPSSVPKRF